MIKNVTLSENGDPFSQPNDLRLNGFNRSLARHGLSFGQHSSVQVYHTEATMESGLTTARELIASPKRPTAIICLADVQAMGVYEACAAAGLSIPGDVSVVGFDDIPLAPFMNPPLTTLRQPGFMKGESAAHLLMEMIAKRPAESMCMDSELILRDSLAGPKA